MNFFYYPHTLIFHTFIHTYLFEPENMVKFCWHTLLDLTLLVHWLTLTVERTGVSAVQVTSPWQHKLWGVPQVSVFIFHSLLFCFSVISYLIPNLDRFFHTIFSCLFNYTTRQPPWFKLLVFFFDLWKFYFEMKSK